MDRNSSPRVHAGVSGTVDWNQALDIIAHGAPEQVFGFFFCFSNFKTPLIDNMIWVYFYLIPIPSCFMHPTFHTYISVQSVEGMKAVCTELQLALQDPERSAMDDFVKDADRLVSMLANKVQILMCSSICFCSLYFVHFNILKCLVTQTGCDCI